MFLDIVVSPSLKNPRIGYRGLRGNGTGDLYLYASQGTLTYKNMASAQHGLHHTTTKVVMLLSLTLQNSFGVELLIQARFLAKIIIDRLYQLVQGIIRFLNIKPQVILCLSPIDRVVMAAGLTAQKIDYSSHFFLWQGLISKKPLS